MPDKLSMNYLFSKYSITSQAFNAAALCRAVSLRLFVQLIAAPCSRRHFTMSTFPDIAAKCRECEYVSKVILTSAPETQN